MKSSLSSMMPLILAVTLLCGSLLLKCVGLDEGILEKDLYKTLGVDPKSSQQEIKKAYRNLAKVHHPDKSTPANKEINEALFRDIAEAYEVLSDPVQRNEYDSLFSVYRHSNKRHSSFREHHGGTAHGGHGHYEPRYEEYYEHHYNDNEFTGSDYPNSHARHHYYEENFGDPSDFDPYGDIFAFAEHLRGMMHRPVVTGPIIPSGEVMFPYTPIMISSDGSHFAMLDIHCSFTVYKGDVRVVMDSFMMGAPPDMTTLPVEVVFRSEGDSSLQGQCFAGLDDRGVFGVYRGHPAMPDYTVLWATPTPQASEDDSTMYSSFFQRHFLELSVTGELAVRMMTVGNSESQCIWSTTSCNRVLAAIREFRIHSMEILRESKAVVAEMLGELREEFNKLIDGSDIMKDIVAAIRAVFNSIRNVLTSIVRLIVNRGDSDSDNNTRKTRGQKKSKKNNSNGNGNSNSNDANRRRDSNGGGSSNGNNNNKNKKDRQRQRGADDTGRYYRGYQY